MDTLIIFCAKYLVLLVVLGLAAAWLPLNKETKKRFVIATVLAGGIALILSRLAGQLYYDPRPFVTKHVVSLIAHKADNGFPSDHALFTMTLTAVTYFFNKKLAGLMLLATIAIGAARVLANVHSPIDIAGGWALGIAGAIAGYYLAGWLLSKRKATKAT